MAALGRFRSRFSQPQLVGNVPGILVYNGLMGIGEDHQLIGSSSPALFGLEVLTDRLAQHRMPQVFLPVQDVAHSGGRPTVRVCHFVVSAIFGEVLGSIGGWNQNLLHRQLLGNGCRSNSLAGQAVNLSDNLSGRFIHKKQLLVLLGPLVAVRDRAAAPHSFLHPGLEYRLDLVAGVLGVPLVHDVQERGEVVVGGLCAVHAVVDGDEADALLGEHNLGVVAHLQVVPPESAQVFDNQGGHMARLNLAQKGVEAWAVEVGAGVAIVPKVPDVPQSMVPGVLLQVHLLVLNAVGFAYLFVIPG